MTPSFIYAMRRTLAVLILVLCVTWITPPLDNADADGGTLGGGREEASRPTTVQPIEERRDMEAPQQLGEVPADEVSERWQLKTYGRSDLGIEVRWFHPQTGDLMLAATYDVKTGDLLPEVP